MNKYQTPNNEIIEGTSPQAAVWALREKKGHSDKYYDRYYDFELDADGLHLKDRNRK